MSGNLTYSDEEEKSVDKLIALSLGSVGAGRESHLNSLGVSLIAFKYAQRPDYFIRAVRQLGHALAWRKVKNRSGVAKQAVTEFVIDMCHSCLGAREISDREGLVRPCLTCGASGRRRYSDEERKGIPGKAMSEAHGIISLAVSVAVQGAIRRLR
jgi:hypothetical protein